MKVNANALLEGCEIANCQGSYGFAVIPEDDGWGLWSKSDSKISMVKVKLPVTAFPDGYEKGDDFAVKSTFFAEALLPNTTPDIDIVPGKITIRTDKRKQSTRLDGGDVREYAKTMPSYSPNSTMAIMSEDLIKFFKQKQIKDFKGVNGVKLTLTEEGLKASTIDDLNEFEDFLPCDAVVMAEEETYANFNIDMLIPMIACMPKGALVTLGFNTHSPLELSIDTDNVEATLLLAPLIPEDE